MKRSILFDLDGTITDSGEGIMNCAELALRHFGLPVPDRTAMRVFVGPPLHDTFRKFGVPADHIEEAVQVFRSRYTTIGKFENAPYPGIRQLLDKLNDQGHKLYIATSKPENMAIEILNKFELSDCFQMICGASLDTSRIKKEDVIAYLLAQTGGDDNTVMVGDTEFDVSGAAAHGIPTIGVSWGYGTEAAMIRAGAAAVAHTMDELLLLLNQ